MCVSEGVCVPGVCVRLWVREGGREIVPLMCIDCTGAWMVTGKAYVFLVCVCVCACVRACASVRAY